MGACNIEFDLAYKAKKTQIAAAFILEQQEGAYQNGHQEGYSGDFQTVHEVLYHLDITFDTYEEAHEYCLENAQKWSNVIAVYYLGNGQVNTLVAGWGAC